MGASELFEGFFILLSFILILAGYSYIGLFFFLLAIYEKLFEIAKKDENK